MLTRRTVQYTFRIDWAFPSYPPTFHSPIPPTLVYKVASARQSID
jgi:hypothetical protein